jgi:phosphatidylserine/phosphatidylglycerophosphate/cardiolipin synthase-like enzyme
MLSGECLFKIIHNQAHYSEVIENLASAKKYIWIGTSDIKDLHMKAGKGRAISLLAVFNRLLEKKIALRLLHAKKPGEAFMSSLQKYPFLMKNMEQQICPRVHFKIIIVDGKWAYSGSANLTGAGLGIKNDYRRNFETGFITDEKAILEDLMNQFDTVWMGIHCAKCQRKAFCPEPIA